MVENVLAMNLHISARVPMGSRDIVVRSELPSVSLFAFLCCCKSIELWSYVQSGNKWDERLEHVMMIPESEAR